MFIVYWDRSVDSLGVLLTNDTVGLCGFFCLHIKAANLRHGFDVEASVNVKRAFFPRK